jgi:superfamily II DNA or RNA helicase
MRAYREHQINAIESFDKHYYQNIETRGILSMCCGSGKSYTFYGIMDKCISKYGEKLFIYATSRRLLVHSIAKDIIEWSYLNNLNIDILIKASIPIGKIYEELRHKYSEDANFTIYIDQFQEMRKLYLLGNKEAIIDSLKSRYITDNKKILIITTYDSIKDIISAISTINSTPDKLFNDIIPDLLAMDEAHNLVSIDNQVKTAKLLLTESEENKFNPSKYLFMTATPLKVIKRNTESTWNGDDIQFSMCNTNIYGEVFFEYTFYEGINNNPQCIIDFDVIYLDDTGAKDDQMIELTQRLKNLSKDAQQYTYFNIISQLLIKIIKIYKLKHVLLYLSNRDKVKSLQSELIKYKTNEEIYIMISGQSDTENASSKQKFEEDNNIPKILISVGMLDEGVDIPIVDSIFFVEERNSETIIVQNIGRALRLHSNKNKAYVILPTKIYTFDNSIENAYASKFKKIREICDILKEPPTENKPKYFNRLTKGDLPAFKNDNNDEDVANMSEHIDSVKNVHLDDNLLDNPMINVEECIQLSSAMVQNIEIASVNGTISNMSLEKLKLIIQKENIQNLGQLTKLIREKKLIINRPHKEIKSHWICYGDLLFNKIYTYEEAISEIQKHDLSNITNSLEWTEFYDKLIEDEFEHENNINELNPLFYIPNHPKTYYLENWASIDKNKSDWEKFLGKNLQVITGVQIHSKKSSVSECGDKNLDNISNNDKFKVQKLLKGEWQSFRLETTDISQLKTFIDIQFSINSYFDIRFELTDRGALKSKVINVKIIDYPSSIIPIVIDFNAKMKYDKIIYNTSALRSAKISRETRTEEINIHNFEVQNIIRKDILTELNNFIRQNRDA